VSEKVEILHASCRALLDEFARVCRENGLRWFVDSGTLLGCIRHGGMIPWDDDADVVMPREDYNKLLECGDSAFGDRFFLESYKTTKTNRYTMFLIDLQTTCLQLKDLSRFYRPDGKHFFIPPCVGMNIEPLDFIPKDLKKQNELEHINEQLRKENAFGFRSTFSEREADIYLKGCMERAAYLNAVLTESSNLNKDSGVVFCPSWWCLGYNGCSISESCFSDYLEKDFIGCKEKMRVPYGYDEILRVYYGDYHIELRKNIDNMLSLVILDNKHSYRDYECLNNQQIREIILNKRCFF